MSLVPSHNRLPLREPAGNTGVPIDPHSFIRPFRSAHIISRTDPAGALVHPLTQRFLIFDTDAIHLLAGCDRSDDPFARTTRRYL